MKPKILLNIFLLLNTLITSAQDVGNLQKHLQQAKTPKDKIYALDALANYYSWTEGGHDEAKTYGQQMIALAEESKNTEFVALAYILNGIRLVEVTPSTEREKELRGYFAKAIQIAKEHKLPFYEAAAYIGLSGIHFHVVLADGDEMLRWGTQAFRLSIAIANDSLRVLSLVALANGYRFKIDNIKAFRQFNEAVELAEKNHDPYLLAYCYRSIARFYDGLGDYDKAVEYFLKAIETLRKKEELTYRDLNWLYMSQINTTWSYSSKKEHTKARASANKVMALAKEYNLPNTYKTAPLFQHFSLFVNERRYEEAKAFFKRNNLKLEAFYKNHDFENHLFNNLALIYRNTGQQDSANYYYRQNLAVLGKSIPVWAPAAYRNYGNFLLESGRLSESIQHLEMAKRTSEQFKDLNNLVGSLEDLSKAYNKSGNSSKAYSYQSLYVQLKDSLAKLSNNKDLALLEVQQEQKKLDQEQREKQKIAEYRNRMRMVGLIAGLGVLLIIAIILYRNNKQKQKANALLQDQKQKVEQALEELKITQTQLIQSEKMASLGELTAGIAHEIQNPLNFVNNFSDVNDELIEELKNELQADNKGEALAIANDIKVNGQKINHHGKRADAIVKGMLQHSRVSTGIKEPTDINALADEYLRLSYHGLRAKDNSFNADFKTDFDERIGKIEVVPQDIGRVLLNLYNNAFYSVNEKKKQQGEGYEPTVSVSTKRLNDKVEVKVSDNGNGIAQNIVDKIYQPFFTTKPTGQGTGLGLSLSYDIIKAHGGEIKVESKEGEGSIFIISIPNY
jgi:signal transduction histidine kinase